MQLEKINIKYIPQSIFFYNICFRNGIYYSIRERWEYLYFSLNKGVSESDIARSKKKGHRVKILRVKNTEASGEEKTLNIKIKNRGVFGGRNFQTRIFFSSRILTFFLSSAERTRNTIYFFRSHLRSNDDDDDDDADGDANNSVI